jgi:glycosyltransferase involved in cell wall biosynthesis
VRIALLSPLYVSVPPRGYGGTERVVSVLADELVRVGHDVTLFAPAGSRTTARLRPMCPAPLWESATLDMITPHVLEVEEAIRCAEQFDIIHSHLECLPWLAADRLRTPMVTTLHSRLDTAELRTIFEAHPEQPLVSISDRQRAPIADLDLNWMATVHHGLRLEQDYQLGAGDGGYLAFLGRIGPEKDPGTAIQVAIRAGIPIKIAARLRPEEEPYFNTWIRPHLDNPLVEWVGELDDPGKNRLLGGARALLAPFAWDEPFGLVFPEALACGTPVIARPRGSVTEIIRHGEHGLLAETEDELVEACRLVGEIDRGACRRYAVERFSPARMVDDYERIFVRLIGREPGGKESRELPGGLAAE